MAWGSRPSAGFGAAKIDLRGIAAPDGRPMARSVVLKGTSRCVRCQLPLRWCICAGQHTVDCPVRVDVLMHHMEAHRPSSTGHLIKRILPNSGQHVYRRERPLVRADLVRPGKTLWILHPLGEPMPAETPPADLQVLLIDGSWRQALDMMRVVETWGRRVRLPMTGASRYWLRAQQGDAQFSTIEALLFLLGALGLQDAHAQLRLQFELHVYAGLCARGKKAAAAEFLTTSPLRAALPHVVQQLAQRVPHSS